ncbi:unnamed protein product [Schistosoma mattheei]|uniref:Uncharacterized protein n=1 Tax=Schistosoma mattheei TaxID=31246 RepID=A0A183PLZ5_9TREM|nr:unnamed protein product [Schistosoma mattheei]
MNAPAGYKKPRQSYVFARKTIESLFNAVNLGCSGAQQLSKQAIKMENCTMVLEQMNFTVALNTLATSKRMSDFSLDNVEIYPEIPNNDSYGALFLMDSADLLDVREEVIGEEHFASNVDQPPYMEGLSRRFGLFSAKSSRISTSHKDKGMYLF